MEKRKTALVTGGSGYLGSHLSKALKRDGWNVVNFDIAKPKHEYCDLYVDGDIRDQYDIKKLFDRINVDTVFHLAGRIEVGESKNRPSEFWHVNVGGTTNLLNAMTYWGVRNILFSSSAGVYHNSEHALTENEMLVHNNPYANTKIACEQAIEDSGLNYIIFRYFNLAGADPEGELGECHLPETHLIPRIFQNLNNFTVNGNDHNTLDGTCIRDYIHVSDVADAHLYGAYYLRDGGESKILNLGTGKGYSILEIIKLVEKITGEKVNFKFLPKREGDPSCLIADASLAEKILTFRPNYDIIDIIQTGYNWHKKHDKIRL